MGSVVFPDYVEKFIESTTQYLEFFKAGIKFTEEYPETQARYYEISTAGGEVELIVHRTSASLDQPVGEYRVRAIAHLTPEIAGFVRGLEMVLNRYATLGALVVTEKDASVLCQCIIDSAFSDTTAGILAAAIVNSRPSILESYRRAVAQDPPPSVEILSAWTDLDFEQIHYDYAHLGIGSLGTRRWTTTIFPHGTLSLDAVHNNPYWGGGLLCLSRIPEEILAGEGGRVDVNALNSWENLVGDAPSFGGWCRDTNDIVFTQFFPNMMKGLPNCTDLLISWARSRIRSASQLVEFEREFQKGQQKAH